jgi:hypothetical protein
MRPVSSTVELPIKRGIHFIFMQQCDSIISKLTGYGNKLVIFEPIHRVQPKTEPTLRKSEVIRAGN